jgi:competence protein ComEC
LQLWINPFEITLVGFQLSYLAVLGIFALYKPFNELVDSDNRLISWIWPVIAVSVAAQLATSPLASHYFNMFPVYFLLTNLIVVPLAGIIIYLAISLLVAGAVGLTFQWLAWPLKWSLQFMQVSVEMIQGWPGAVITPIVLSRLQVILIYLIIVSCCVFFMLKYRKWVFVTLGSCLCLFMLFAADLYKKMNTTEITVYQVSGHTAIDLIHNRKAVFIADSLLVTNSKKIDFQVKPNRIHKGVKELTNLITENDRSLILPGIYADGTFIFFEGKKLVLLNEHWTIRKTESRFDCDVLIISGKAVLKPEDLITWLNMKQVVIDSSVPFYKADKLKLFFEKEGIACHSVRHSGAYVLKW